MGDSCARDCYCDYLTASSSHQNSLAFAMIMVSLKPAQDFRKDEKMKAKKVLSMVLAFALVLGCSTGIMGRTSSGAEAAEKMVVYVAAEGTAAGDAVKIDKTAVQVSQGDTAEVAVRKVLDKYYKDNYGYDKGFLSSIGNLAGSTSEPWVYWGFRVNGAEPQNPATGWGFGIGDYPLQENDQISLVYGTFEEMPAQCSCFDNDASIKPDQAAVLQNARAQEKLLAEKIYQVNFRKGGYVPGIEDTDSLYAVFSLAQSGFQANAFYDKVCKKVLSQLQGMKEQGKIYDPITGKEMSFASYEGNKYVLINYTKIALVLSALGVDIAKAGGVNLAEKMTDRSLYEVANATTLTREALILFAMHLSGASWSMGNGHVAEKELVNNLLADVDSQIGIAADLGSQWGATLDSAAMCVQALAPYVSKKVEGVDGAEVKRACEKVMDMLSAMQDNQTGGFSGASGNAWTLAQCMITVGLLEEGVNPLTDTSFIKNGQTLFDASGKYVDAERGMVDENLVGGEYAYQPDQLLRGLTSCLRRVDGIGLFDVASSAYRADVKYILLTGADVKAIANHPYTGNPVKPKVTVVVAGKALAEGRDYSLSYHDNTQVGEAYVLVTGMGEYRGTAKAAFKIVQDSKKPSNAPAKAMKLKKPVIKKLSSKRKALTVKFGKVKNAKKYVIQIAIDRKFQKNTRKKTVKLAKSVTFKKLKAGKKYYVRVRAYGNAGKSIKSSYSKVKSKRIKR